MRTISETSGTPLNVPIFKLQGFQKNNEVKHLNTNESMKINKRKSTRENQQIIYKGIFMKLPAEFPAKTLQARREWHDIFMYLKR